LTIGSRVVELCCLTLSLGDRSSAVFCGEATFFWMACCVV
jgi:hypothetical protein